MPYYDIPSYAEYEGYEYDDDELYEGACTHIACLIPEDKPDLKQEIITALDFPF